MLQKNKSKCFIVALPKGFKLTPLILSRMGQTFAFQELKEGGSMTNDIFKELKEAYRGLKKYGDMESADSFAYDVFIEYFGMNRLIIADADIPNHSMIKLITSTKSEKSRLRKVVDTYDEINL